MPLSARAPEILVPARKPGVPRSWCFRRRWHGRYPTMISATCFRSWESEPCPTDSVRASGLSGQIDGRAVSGEHETQMDRGRAVNKANGDREPQLGRQEKRRGCTERRYTSGRTEKLSPRNRRSDGRLRCFNESEHCYDLSGKGNDSSVDDIRRLLDALLHEALAPSEEQERVT